MDSTDSVQVHMTHKISEQKYKAMHLENRLANGLDFSDTYSCQFNTLHDWRWGI